MKYLAFVAIIIVGLAQEPTKAPEGKGASKGNSAKVAEHTQSTNKGDHPATNTSPASSNPTISKQNNVEPALHDDHTQASGNETTKQDLKIQRQLSLFTGLFGRGGTASVCRLDRPSHCFLSHSEKNWQAS